MLPCLCGVGGLVVLAGQATARTRAEGEGRRGGGMNGIAGNKGGRRHCGFVDRAEAAGMLTDCFHRLV